MLVYESQAVQLVGWANIHRERWGLPLLVLRKTVRSNDGRQKGTATSKMPPVQPPVPRQEASRQQAAGLAPSLP